MNDEGMVTRILAEAEALQQDGSALHQHSNYDCGGKGHGSDVSEVQWCHDCTPLGDLTDDKRYICLHRHTIAECVRMIEDRGYRIVPSR